MAPPSKVIYTGEYRHSRDAKGRLTIPSKWRPRAGEEDEDYLALPNPSNRSITIYPPRRAAKFIERMEELSIVNPEEQVALVKLSAIAQSFTYDSQGRMSLSDKLLKYAGIEGKEVVLQGNFSTFSIWNPERYDSVVADDVDKQSEELSELLPKLGLI